MWLLIATVAVAAAALIGVTVTGLPGPSKAPGSTVLLLALLVVGFAAGQGIPEVKVNRLLLNNIDVRGVGWGAYAMARTEYMQQQWAELVPMIEAGFVKPPIGATYELEDFGRALQDMDDRLTLGKSVVRVR